MPTASLMSPASATRSCPALLPEEEPTHRYLGHQPRQAAVQADDRTHPSEGDTVTVKRYASVWDAIEDTPGQAENLKIRSALMQELSAHIIRAGVTQTAASQQFGVTQPRISDLMRGKIDLFSIDTLVNMLPAAGLHVDLRVRRAS